LTPDAHEALLLKSIEGFTTRQIAEIMQIPANRVEALLTTARQEMRHSAKGRIMMIEDEALIAADMHDRIIELGHDLFGIARTRTEAVALVRHATPDLILSDIQLAAAPLALMPWPILCGTRAKCPQFLSLLFLNAY